MMLSRQSADQNLNQIFDQNFLKRELDKSIRNMNRFINENEWRGQKLAHEHQCLIAGEGGKKPGRDMDCLTHGVGRQRFGENKAKSFSYLKKKSQSIKIQMSEMNLKM